MVTRIFTYSVIAAVIYIGSTPAFACQGTKVLFEDNFSTVDSGWSEDNQITIGGGLMKITSRHGTDVIAWYDADTFEKADICVNVRELAGGDAPAGIMFAGEDDDNYYAFFVYPEGEAEVSRYKKGKALDVVHTKAAKVGHGSISLRLTLYGTRAIAYIGDVKFAEFKVDAPHGGGKIGLIGGSPDDSQATWGFSNLKVTDLPY
jgi:hypothetical protein